MNHTDLTAASQISHRFDLGETPTFERIQRLLYDLYACARLDPGYLFLAEQDHSTLTAEIGLNNAYCAYPWSLIANEFGLDLPLSHSGYRGIHHLSSSVTGSSVRVVPLPGLEERSVIVGFFR